MPGAVALTPARPRGGLLAQHLLVYRSPVIAAPASGFFFYTICYVAILTLLPGALPRGWGHLAGVFLPLVSILVSMTAGVWLLGRMPAVRVTQGGFLLAMLAVLALWLGWESGPAAFAASLVLGAGLGLVPGSSYAAVPQLNAAPDDRAWASGAIAQTGNLGTTLGTPLLAVVMQKAGGAGLAVFVLCFSALGIAIVALQEARRRP
jgi:DHA1 family inner membrane transport protein